MEGMLQRLSSRVDPASIVDIGAARGEWTTLAKRFFPGSRVLMIEPLIENAAALQRTASECEHVEFEIVAVGDSEREITFHVVQDNGKRHSQQVSNLARFRLNKSAYSKDNQRLILISKTEIT